MSRIKIRDYKGYTIEYNPVAKEFGIRDSEGQEISKALDQEAAERKIDGYGKLKFKRLLVFRSEFTNASCGAITSYQSDDSTCWYVSDSARSLDRFKIRLSSQHTGLFLRTPENEEIKKQIDALNEQAKGLMDQAKALVKTLQGEITIDMLKKYAQGKGV